jgi:hypothetical protein
MSHPSVMDSRTYLPGTPGKRYWATRPAYSSKESLEYHGYYFMRLKMVVVGGIPWKVCHSVIV